MRREIKIILMTIVLILLLATVSFGEFVCSENDVCTQYNIPSIIGIYHAMRRDQGNWINSPVPQYNGYAGEQGGGALGYGTMIYAIGAECFGHGGAPTSDGYRKIAVVDMDENEKDEEELYLAHAIYHSIQAGETGSEGTYKNRIRLWLHNHRGDIGILGQNDTNRAEDYRTAEAIQYANGLKQEKCDTSNNKEGEGARQTIEYKNGYTFIGPYNLVSYYGSFTKATIYDRQGNSHETKLCSTDGRTVENIAGKANYSGSNFYLVVDREIESVKEIYIEKTFPYYAARLVASQPNGGSGTQNVAIFYGEARNAAKRARLPGVPFSTIKVTKIDQDNGRPIANVGFIVYNETEKKWVKEGSPAAQYVNDKSQATVYRTDANGKINIKNLSKKGVYKLYEVINPHFGYKEASMEEPSQEITINIKAIGNNPEQTISNKRIYVKLSGYTWEDIPDSGKEAETNNLYLNTDNDKRLNNITVTLRKANGEIIDTKVTNTILNTKEETEQGAYLFGDYQRDPETKRILIEDLRGAYIEFEYNGMCYQSVPINLEMTNGSKARDDKEVSEETINEKPREVFNQNFGTIVKDKAQTGDYDLKYDTANHKSIINYGGTYQYGYEGQKYPISGIDSQYLMKANTLDSTAEYLLGETAYTIENIYQDEIEEIPNINLGLREREMPDISLVQDIDRTTISLNGYTHTYRYADRFSKLNQEIENYLKEHPDDGTIFNVGVNFGQGENKYTGTIYSSDIVYDDKEEPGSLDVRIIYKVKLTNEASSVHTVANQLYNYYDNDYEIASIKYVDDQGNVTGQLTNEEYTEDRNYQQQIDGLTYTRVLIHPKEGTKLRANTHQYIEIEYKLKREAILRILNQEKTLNSVTEIVSYSSYSDNDFTIPYAGIDRDSAPNNMTVGNEATYEDDTNHAPTLTLTSHATRSIEGTVWQDNAIEELLDKTGFEKERIGNGQYDEAQEDVIENVQVELLKLDQYGNPQSSRLYQAQGQEGNKKGIVIPEDQVTKQTDEKGWYKFEGIIPGEYVIRFTYKNNSVLYSPDGEMLKTLEGVIEEESEGKVEGGVEYYKSTLYRTKREEDGTLITRDYSNEQEYGKNGENGWYAIDTREPIQRLSDAKDNQDIAEYRTEVEELTYTGTTTASKLEQISADTHQITINMGCNEDDLNNISKFGQTLKHEFKNVDFGIIRRPKQDLKINKEISNIEVVLANGQLVVKGDPRHEEIPHLKFMPDGNIHIELDNEIIQGATLKLDYEVTVDNKRCEIDYNDLDYYYYGKVNKDDEHPNGNWKIATVSDLLDYPNSGLNFNKDANEGWDYITLDELMKGGRISKDLEETLRQYNIILHTTDFGTMNPGEDKKKNITFTRLLSNANDELAYDNDVEINTYNGRKTDFTIPGNYNPSDAETEENDNSSVDMMITGPTGKKQNYLPYIIIGITSLIILASGIILIKKKMSY